MLPLRPIQLCLGEGVRTLPPAKGDRYRYVSRGHYPNLHSAARMSARIIVTPRTIHRVVLVYLD